MYKVYICCSYSGNEAFCDYGQNDARTHRYEPGAHGSIGRDEFSSSAAAAVGCAEPNTSAAAAVGCAEPTDAIGGGEAQHDGPHPPPKKKTHTYIYLYIYIYIYMHTYMQHKYYSFIKTISIICLSQNNYIFHNIYN